MGFLVIMRHGETQFNVECRFQGQLNNPLNKRGQQQVLKSATLLEELLETHAISIQHVQVSDLSRALQSYAILQPYFPGFPEPRHTSFLREKALGLMEGLTIREFLETGPEAKKHYHQHLKDLAYHPKHAKLCQNAESTLEVASRLYREVKILNRIFLEKKVLDNQLWLYHGSAIRYTLDILQVAHYKKFPKLGNADILLLKPLKPSLSADPSSLAYEVQSEVKWELVEHIKVGHNISADVLGGA